MLHHYSAAKYQSVKLKHRAYEVAAKISTYESWEMVPYDVLQEADREASIKANKLMQQDQTILWLLPPDALQLQAVFSLRNLRSKSRWQKYWMDGKNTVQQYWQSYALAKMTLLC